MLRSGNVTVIVSDMKRAIDFYVNTLELTLQYAEENGFWAQIAGPGLTIGLHPRNPGRNPGRSESLSIGFEVDNLDAAVQWLADRHITAHRAPGDIPRVTFEDPDGNPLYVIETPTR